MNKRTVIVGLCASVLCVSGAAAQMSVELGRARAFARFGMVDSALTHLDSAAALGADVAMIATEPDLVTIRNAPRYQALVARLEPARFPCRGMPETHQLDFWVGDWVVTPWAGVSANPGRRAENHIHPILEHCIVLEEWTSATGGAGKSFNLWDPNHRAWRQIWNDDSGSVLDYEGQYRDGAMHFAGWTLGPNGRRVLQKLTLTKVGADTVRQTIEQSTDAGKTWNTSYDFRYVRKPAVAPPCGTDSAYHALDLWIGAWRVTDSAGVVVGHSRIEPMLGDCAIMENWTEPDGSEGKSLFYYTPSARQWKQVWITPNALAPGGMKEKHLIAIYPGGGVRFQGEIIGPAGRTILDRTTLTPLGDGRVRQVIEVSRDGGTRWVVNFDAVYTRDPTVK